MATTNLNVVVKLVDQLTGPAKQLSRAISDIEKMVSRTSNSNAFGGITRGAQRAVTQINLIGQAAQRAQSQVQSLSSTISAIGGARPSASGISSFANQATASLRQLSSQLSRLQSQYAQLSQTRPPPRLPVAPTPRTPGGYGAAAVVAGGPTFSGVGRGVGRVGTQAGDLRSAAVKQELAGLDAGEMARIQAASWQMTQQYRNFSAATIQNAILEMRSVYGSTDQAISGIGVAMQSATVLRNQLRGRVDQQRIVDEVFNLFKSADLRNVTDSPQETERFIDNMTKVITATGGRIMPRDFLQLLKYGKTGTQFWNDDFITRVAASVMQEGSPSTVGTALTSMYQSVVSGRVQQRSAELFQQLGLVDPSGIIRSRDGNVRGFRAGAVQNWQQFQINPYEWAQRTLAPALMRRLGMGNRAYSSLSEQEQNDFNTRAMPLISQLFGNRNADWITNTLLKSRPIERDRALIDQAQGIAGAPIIQNKDLFTAWEGLTTQLNNLMGVLAGPLVQPAINMLNSLSSSLSSLSATIAANPDLANLGSTALLVAGGLISLAAAVRTVALALAVGGFAMGAGGGALGGAATAAGGAAAGAGALAAVRRWGTGLLRGAGILGGAVLGKEALGAVDPGGNFWGLTNPIDRWMQDRFGFNLAGRTPQQLFPERYAGIGQQGAGPTPQQVGAAAPVAAAQQAATQLRGLVAQANAIVTMPVGPESVAALQQLQSRIQQAQGLIAQARSGQQSAGRDVWLGLAERASADLEFALGSIRIKMQSSGQEIGSGMMSGTAAGVQAGIPQVIAQAQALLAQMQSVLSQGVTVPIRPSVSPVPGAGGGEATPGRQGSVDPGVQRQLGSSSSAVASSRSSSTSVGAINVYGAPGMDERRVAELVDRRFRDATRDQLSDGVFA